MWRLWNKKTKAYVITFLCGLVVLAGWCVWGLLKGQLLKWITSPLFITVGLLSLVVLAFALCDRK